MTPRRIVAALLEADDLLPQGDVPPQEPGGFDIDSIKDYIGNVEENPLEMHGVPIRGYYQSLARRFEGRRPKQDGPVKRIKIENNTWLEHDRHTDWISVRLHYTDIITVKPDDTLTVDNGGYQTKVTLTRLNDYLPSGWRIYTHRHTWYWHLYGHNDEDANPGWKRLQPYTNGDRILADGTLVPQAGPEFKRTRGTPRAKL